jgi:hypothetical protein
MVGNAVNARCAEWIGQRILAVERRSGMMAAWASPRQIGLTIERQAGLILGMSNYMHPSQMKPEQRREANAALQDRMARAMERAGGLSAKRDAPVARAAAKRIRAGKWPTR